jgi:hypothetical protein
MHRLLFDISFSDLTRRISPEFSEQVENACLILSETADFLSLVPHRFYRGPRIWQDDASASHFWTPTGVDDPPGYARLCRSRLS